MKAIEDMEIEEIIAEIKKRLKSFNRDEYFVFVSYSKRDREVVYKKVLEWMRDGYNIYIDMDFENHGSDENWIEQMTRIVRANRCAMATIFRSENYYFSYASLIELLTMRSQKTEKSRSAAINKKLPIDIIELSNKLVRDGADFSSSDLKRTYKETFSKVKEKHPDAFLQNNFAAKSKFEEGSESLKIKISELNSGEEEYVTYDNVNENYLMGYTDFYPQIAKIMSIWFNCHNLNGNIKSIKDTSGVLARFKELEVYRCSEDTEVNVPKKEEIKEETKEEIKKEIKKEEPVAETSVQVEKAETIKEEKNKPEIQKKHVPVNVKSGGEIPMITSYTTNITKEMTLSEFEKLFEDVNFALYLRNLRANGGKNYSKQIVDYVMAALLRGCDEKAEEDSARWKYCTYAVAKNVDMNNPSLGASQFTWQSNSRKAVGIEGSGKLGENSSIFSKLSSDLSLGSVEQKFIDGEGAFNTKDNSMVERVFEALYGTK